MHPVWFFLNGVPTGGVIAPSRVLAGAGSVSAPSIAFSAEPTTGWYSAAANGMSYAAAGEQFAQFNGPTLFLLSNTAAISLGASSDVTVGRGAAGTLTLMGATATPAGGSTSLRLVFGSTAGFGIYIGSGAPTVSAAQGSLYLRSNGTGTGDRAYINTNGSTTWTALTTAA